MTQPPQIGATAQQRLADRLTQRGMHPETARNVVAHVAEHGRHSPWAREVNAAAVRLTLQLYAEYTQQFARAALPALQQVAHALRSAARAVEAAHTARPGQCPLAPPPAAPNDRPAWQTPYGPPTRHR